MHNQLDKPIVFADLLIDDASRSQKLYGLLGALMKGRALQMVKSVEAGNGLEAYRQLTLTLKSKEKSRGLALLGVLTSFPPFNMQQSLQGQVLRLEEVISEAEKAGTTVADELRAAILLKSISGQLKNFLNVHLSSTSTYAELRERILKWNRPQIRWNQTLIPTTTTTGGNDQGPTPMDVDRAEFGKGGKKGKKGKQKGYGNYGGGKEKGKV